MQNGLEKLNELMWGYRAARALHVLVGLKVFSHLKHGAQTTDRLAADCRIDAELLEKLLIAGAAMGLLAKQGDAWRNTELSDDYLVEGRPLYQGNIIDHAAMVWDVWGDLPAKAGLAKQTDDNAPAAHHNFILGMHNITMAGRGELFLKAVDLSGRKNLLDIGGGPGTYSILACQRYPALRSTVFDLPETVAIACGVIAEHGLTERIATRPGSWETDDFGSGFDAALLSNVLHGPASQAAMKLKKAFLALTPGGLLAVQEFLMTNDKTGPLLPALFNVMIGAYSNAELTAEIAAVGFTEICLVGKNDAIGSAWMTAIKP